ncbi:Superfamily II DNA and RNA helicase [Roseivivax lentus]|uniref:DEAD-box ATP-dependent RNA helicase RhpA n=1 Tax=Roseivivax lentus TaxID=633194 RepID=A0A1N7LA65_9RHOB|nr:DEAD/DEAH box helicase [Roseivivax lentus]SIS70689.1 Superfamily II DNA and RNA helicase [Roseivivax lentus]
MTKFTDLNLGPKVLKAVIEAGYETPTPIQAGAIPPALEGRDVLGIAQTGTGKTASFTLPMITKLARGRARARMPRSLVLCPTRELAAQVAENFETYSKHVKLTKALLIGGVSFKEQDQLIDKGVDVLIATPGRLLDHFERGKLLLTGIEIMVVDEADRMLDMGFIPDIERIFSLTPFTRQTLFFSATMAAEIERITNTFLSNPARIEVARQATASETIAQGVLMLKPTRRDRTDSEKRKALRALVDAEGESLTNAIIFCNRKVDVDIVAKSLKKYGYDAAPIHGDLEQSVRTRTLDGFRNGELKILVASDVAARGLDVPSVSHVFNYDVPSHAEDYVHRIGRTGRAGRDGKAITLCIPRDEKNLEDVERLIDKPIPKLVNPLGDTTPDEESAPDAAPETEAKPKRSRSRSRRKKDDDAPSQAAPETAPAPEAAAEPAPQKDAAAPQDEQPARTRRDADSNRGKRDADSNRGNRGGDDNRGNRDADSSRGNRGGDDNRGKRGGGGRGGRDDNKVVGMGDHMPTFIAMSFEERKAG